MVLATQRPSTRLIHTHDIMQQLAKHNVGAIFNLQLSGEHAWCGDGIESSGFSYDPQHFMNNNILFYNHGWMDMSTPTLEKMLQIVQLMSFHVEKNQKIAIHCHAGYGRTGITIACFFIYIYGFSPENAIKSVRDRRHKCIQTKKQRDFVHTFSEYMHYLRRIFYHVGTPPSSSAPSSSLSPTATTLTNSSIGAGNIGLNSNMNNIMMNAPTFPSPIDPRQNSYTLHECLSRQRVLLHGPERNTLKYIPKLLYHLYSRLIDLAEHAPFLLAIALLEGFRATYTHKFETEFDKERDRRRRKLKLDREQAGQLERYSVAVIERESVRERESGREREHRQNSTTVGTYLSTPNLPQHLRAASPSPLLPDPASPSHSQALSSMASPLPSLPQQPLEYREITQDAHVNMLAPKWTLQQADTYATLKSKLNLGDYSSIESTDIRYCAALLLEWLDQLRLPLLPLLHAQHHNLVLISTSNAFDSLPRYALYVLDPLMRMLHCMREVEHTLLARVYVRIGFALLHPTCAIPPSLCVHDATSRYYPNVEPASKAALDSMVEFFGNFSRAWERMHARILEAEEAALSAQVGVRKVKNFPAQEGDEAPIASVALLQPIPVHTTLKLNHNVQPSVIPVSSVHSAVTQQVGDEAEELVGSMGAAGIRGVHSQLMSEQSEREQSRHTRTHTYQLQKAKRQGEPDYSLHTRNDTRYAHAASIVQDEDAYGTEEREELSKLPVSALHTKQHNDDEASLLFAHARSIGSYLSLPPNSPVARKSQDIVGGQEPLPSLQELGAVRATELSAYEEQQAQNQIGSALVADSDEVDEEEKQQAKLRMEGFIQLHPHVDLQSIEGVHTNEDTKTEEQQDEADNAPVNLSSAPADAVASKYEVLTTPTYSNQESPSPGPIGHVRDSSIVVDNMISPPPNASVAAQPTLFTFKPADIQSAQVQSQSNRTQSDEL